jgi:hypothetical protein
MAVFFIYDQFTDNVNEDEARNCANLVIDILRNPHVERPQGESKLGEITRQYYAQSSVYLSVKLNDLSS